MVFRPSSFGKYVLLKRIAIGGMAEVFRSKAFGAEGFEKLAAVKRMLPHLSSDSQFVDMFINEAKLAANLNQANIVQIYDFGCIDNLYFISMEYVNGKDIADIIRMLRDRNLGAPLELACHIFIEALNGLDYAHRLTDSYGVPLDLIHRDMSPHNILVSYEGEVKIVDFGIAKATSSTVQTTGGVLKGKYSYMSPEQAHGRHLDLRSDLFSLAICFYEMLTQTKMFHADSDLGVLEMVRETEFVMPCELNSSIPKELEDILLRALEKNPDDRYNTAGEFRDELERFLFSNNLHFSTAWLAGFMREIFRDDLEKELDDFAEEAEVVQKLRSEARRAARLEAAALASNTVIIKRGGESEGTFDDEDPSLDESLDVPIHASIPSNISEVYDDETFRGDDARSRPGGLIVVEDSQVMEVDEDDIEEAYEDYNDFNDESLATHKVDRPNLSLEMDDRPSEDSLDEDLSDSYVSLQDDTLDTGPGPDVTSDPMADFDPSTDTGQSPKAGIVDKDVSTLPPSVMNVTDISLPVDPEDKTNPERSAGRFPWRLVITFLALVVAVSAVLCYVWISGGEDSVEAKDKPETRPGIRRVASKDDPPGNLRDRPRDDEPLSLPDTRPSAAEVGKPASVKFDPEAPLVREPSPAGTENTDLEIASVASKQGEIEAVGLNPAPKKDTPNQAFQPPRKARGSKRKTKYRHRAKRRRRKGRRKKTVAVKTEKVETREPTDRTAKTDAGGYASLDVGIPGGWAFVYIDGEKVRTTPLINYRIHAGKHKVELRDGEGQLIRSWSINLQAHKRTKLLHQ